MAELADALDSGIATSLKLLIKSLFCVFIFVELVE